MKGDAGRWQEERVACECGEGNRETGKIVTQSNRISKKLQTSARMAVEM